MLLEPVLTSQHLKQGWKIPKVPCQNLALAFWVKQKGSQKGNSLLQEHFICHLIWRWCYYLKFKVWGWNFSCKQLNTKEVVNIYQAPTSSIWITDWHEHPERARHLSFYFKFSVCTIEVIMPLARGLLYWRMSQRKPWSLLMGQVIWGPQEDFNL